MTRFKPAPRVLAARLPGPLLQLGSHPYLRVAQANYFVTTFANGSNKRQNNLRLSAGIVLHFGK